MEKQETDKSFQLSERSTVIDSKGMVKYLRRQDKTF